MKLTTSFGVIAMALALSSNNLYAQVGVGPNSGAIDGSATLDVKSGFYSSGSPYRGLLLPRVSTDQRSQIQNPATGLLIYNTSTNQIEVNTGTTTAPVWTPGGTASSGGGSFWSINGNAGTSSATNFIGTRDNQALSFRVNNQNAGRIDQFTTNVALGYLALNTAVTGQGNTAIGHRALASITTSNFNTAMGLQALENNTTGSGNTGIGFQTLSQNTTSAYNTAVGFQVLANNTSGYSNTASGFVSLAANTEGIENAAFGALALNKNTTGNQNTAVGAGALQNNTTGYANTALGHNVAKDNTTGYVNVGVGEDALITNIDGYNNVAIGVAALSSNTSGNSNTASGNLTLRLNTTGLSNTASGVLALQYNTTGSFNTGLGYNAGPVSGNSDLRNATAIGANAIVGASNTIVLGDNQITSLRCNVQTISSLSDKRIKENIKADVPGLAFITKLSPVTYHINKYKEAKLVGYATDHVTEDKVLHSGFIAQDVESAAKAIGYDFEGVRKEENGKYYTLGYTLFVIPLVQSVKELNAEIKTLKEKLEQTTASYSQLSEQIKQLQARLEISEMKTGTVVGKK